MAEITINGTPIAKLRVVDLKNELDARGLSKSGKKDELVARLLSYMEHEMTQEKAPNTEETEEKAPETKEATRNADVKDINTSESEDEGKKIAEDAAKKASEEEEKLAAEAKAEEEKQRIEKEKKDAEDKLQREKQALEERKIREAKEEEDRRQKVAEEKRLKEEEERRQKMAEEKRLKEEEERRQKMAEEKRLKEEERLKEERKQKDAEERKRLKEEEQKMEEEKLRKLEDRRRVKDAADQKRREEVENKSEVNVMNETKDVDNDSRKTEQEDGTKKRDIIIEKKKDGEKPGEDSGVSGKDDESLIIEAAADDTLVMEIDQADIVAEEVSKEEAESPMISAEPGQVTSLRRLGGSKPSQDASRKRGWGASKGSTSSANSVTISSNSLKDLVPDIKPLLDTETTIEEEVEECSVDSDADIAGPKIPENVKKESEPVKKKKRIPITDVNETAVVLITHLTRPFTVNQLKEMLKRTGTIVDFWIDRIKSMCCVQFSTVDQASETRMALDGVTWPQGNPKTLRVIFSTEEELKKYQESSTDALNRLGPDSNGRLGGVREWDKNKLDQEQERAKEREKRLAREKERREGKEERERSLEKKAPAVKSLEDLFKKTVAGPAIYWKPLSEKQIQQKIEERNKKIMEAQIRREMMDTKESLQRSNKLLPARRRSRSSSGSSD